MIKIGKVKNQTKKTLTNVQKAIETASNECSKLPCQKYYYHCGQRLDWNFCPQCGGDLIYQDNGNYPEYYEEWFECEKCGFTCDRDRRKENKNE